MGLTPLIKSSWFVLAVHPGEVFYETAYDCVEFQGSDVLLIDPLSEMDLTSASG